MKHRLNSLSTDKSKPIYAGFSPEVMIVMLQ